MSLIADALKAAQRDREEQAGKTPAAGRERMASSTLRSNAAIPLTRKKGSRTRSPASLWGSVALLAGAVAVVAYLVARPDPEPQLAAVDRTSEPINFDDGFSDAIIDGTPSRMLPEIPPSAIAGQPQPNIIVNSTPPSQSSARPSQPIQSDVDDGDGSRTSQFGARLSGVRDAIADRLGAATGDGTFGSSLLSLGRGITDGLGLEGIGSSQRVQDPVAQAEAAPVVIDLTVRRSDPEDDQMFRDAVQSQRVGDLETAAELYTAHLQNQPGHAEALNNLGTVLQAAGDYSGARSAFERALRSDPDYAAAWSNLGMLLEQMGEEADALAALSQALRLDPSNIGARVNLALIHQRRGLTEEARQTLEQVLELEPSHPEAHYALATLLDNALQPSQALLHYRAFLEYGAGRFPQHEMAVRLRIQELERHGVR